GVPPSLDAGADAGADAGVLDPNPYDKLVYLDGMGKPTTLTLNQQGAGLNVYTFNDQTFYPVDGLGWNAGSNPQLGTDCTDNLQHNFSFTSELHYPFTYSATTTSGSSSTATWRSTSAACTAPPTGPSPSTRRTPRPWASSTRACTRST